MGEEGAVTLLDEPSEGMQAENIDRMRDLILDRKSSGKSVVLVEQHLRLAERVADEYIIMDQGRAVLQGGAFEIDRARIRAHIVV